MNLTTREYQIQFLTPAFLGDAHRAGRWRSPPFKALLRQWWRVAWCEDQGFPTDITALRRKEADLFGSAADGTGHRSRLRLRLTRWDRGRLTRWDKDVPVSHPEVRTKVGAQLYLGYGPLSDDKRTRGTTLKANAAIQAREQAGLRLAFPAGETAILDRALALLDGFGALGGRSRNGWGSLRLRNFDPDPSLHLPLRPWQECLDRDWPHAIGSDETGPLIWTTEPFTDWPDLMTQLARIKIGLRTQFAFRGGKRSSSPEPRHWLSYPVTRHPVRDWRQARLPNSLRFKVRDDGRSRLVGAVFHVPCLPPSRPFRPNRTAIEDVWRRVHRYLDQHQDLRRSER